MKVKYLIYLALLVLYIAFEQTGLKAENQTDTLTLSGTVVMEDGSAPEHPLQVQLVCNSRVIQVTPTRAEGSFHFRLGGSRRSTEVSAGTTGPDALETGRRGLGGVAAGGRLRESSPGRYDLTNCEIRLKTYPGWDSDIIRLGVQSVFEPDIGAIQVRVAQGAEGTTVSVTSLEAPEAAAKNLRRARKALEKRGPNYRLAKDRLESAVEDYAGYAEAWSLLGEVFLNLSDPDSARSAFERAIEADPHYLPPLVKLAEMELEKFKWQAALIYTRRLVELDANRAQSHYYHGLANYSLGNYEEAKDSFLAVDRRNAGKQFPSSYLMLGDILARQGRIPASADNLRRFLEIGKHTPEMGEQLRRQLREWEEKGLIEKGRM